MNGGRGSAILRRGAAASWPTRCTPPRGAGGPPAERERHRGWGHSTFDDVTTLALDAGVRTLVHFHHDPDRSDDDIDRHVAESQRRVREAGSDMRVLGAAEGLTLTV